MKMARRIDWLTERERCVLVHLMEGMSAEQIAAAEYVTLTTVRSHIRSILLKLGVRSQHAAVAHAYKACWHNDDERRQEVVGVLERVS